MRASAEAGIGLTDLRVADSGFLRSVLIGETLPVLCAVSGCREETVRCPGRLFKCQGPVEADGCVSATLKALGYPGRVTLTAWVRELDPDARRYVVRRAHRGTRPLPLRQAAVYALCTRRGSAKAIAQRLDVDRVTLYNWKNQLLGRDAPASMKRDKDPPTKTDKAQLEKQVESLRRDIRQLQLERDLLKKANEILKKGLGVDLELLTNREKTMLVDALREAYALPQLLDELHLPRSSYFYHRARLGLADKYAEVRRSIADIFHSNHRCYGYRRIQASLIRRDVVLIAIGRLRTDPRIRAYGQRRISEGHSKLEAIRCLKRYIAREVFFLLKARTKQINQLQAAA